jgi:hypothetical protein
MDQPEEHAPPPIEPGHVMSRKKWKEVLEQQK